MRLLHDLHQTKPRRGDRPRVRPVKTLVAANATTAVAAAAPKKQKKKKESHHEEGTTAVAIAAAPRPTWDGDVYGLEWLDQGGSALIFAVDDARVAKVPLGSTGSRLAFEREREVYRRLNRRRLASGGRACEFVLRCWETEISTGLVLERCAQSVRQYLRERRRPPVLDVGLGGGVGEGVRVGGALLGPPVPAVGEEDVQRAVRWSYEVSHGLEFLHQAGIIHSDLGCQNILLSFQGSVKLADFSGSALSGCEGGEAMVDYAVHYRLPDVEEPDRASDLFALASVMYEIVYGQVPYADLKSEEIERRFRAGRFPCLDEVGNRRLGIIITGCWQQEFASAKKVAQCLERLLKTSSAYRCCSSVPEERPGAHDGEYHQKKEPRDSVLEICPSEDGSQKRTSHRRRVAPQNYEPRPKKESRKQLQSKSPLLRRNRKGKSFWGGLRNHFLF